jgi:flagellin
MAINTDLNARYAQKNLANTNLLLSTNFKNLSSGLRINSASDDPTGLSISERFRSQITGYQQANSNVQDAYGMLNVADGALDESHSILQRLRELSLQSANGATSDDDRQFMQTEVNQLLDELNNISGTTQYNGKNLLDGSLQSSKSSVDAKSYVTSNPYVNVSTVQGAQNSGLVEDVQVSSNNNKDVTFDIKVVAGSVQGTFNAEVYASDSTDGKPVTTINNIQNNQGPVNLSGAGYNVSIDVGQVNSSDLGKTATVRITSQHSAVNQDNSTSFQIGANEGQTIGLGIGNMSSSGLRIQNLNISTQAGGQNAIGMIDDAINRVSTQRTKIGATQNRLESILSANDTNILNQTESESGIRDLNFAMETLSLATNNMLQQAGTSVLAQANASAQQVLSLLGAGR